MLSRKIRMSPGHSSGVSDSSHSRTCWVNLWVRVGRAVEFPAPMGGDIAEGATLRVNNLEFSRESLVSKR